MSEARSAADGEETLPEGVSATGKGKRSAEKFNPRIAKQHLPVVTQSPAELTRHFRMRDRLTQEETLAPIRKQFSVVDQVISERDAAKTRVAQLEIQLAEFNELKQAHEGAVAEIEKLRAKVQELIDK